MDSRHEVKSLKKALKALTFMNQRGDTSVSEVALAIGVPRPTSYRILETLASEGYVEKQRHSVFYRITSRVQGLAAGFQDEERLLEVAKPLIEASGAELGWPISLYTPRDKQMIARINTDYDCALALERFNIGFAAPMLHATSGYCFLAHCLPQERDQMVMRCLADEELPPNYPQPGEGRYLSVSGNVTHLTRFNRSRYEEISLLLRLVQERGFCNIEFTEYREGNLGVPLVVAGRAVGGIVMRYIKSVMKNTDRIQSLYVPKVQQLAADITKAYLALEIGMQPRRLPSRMSDGTNDLRRRELLADAS
jgi:DNA-binding IclR family transcriptional regulator